MKKEIINIAKELQLENSKILGPVIFHGNSMSPFLEEGDELIVITVNWGEIKIGDIITYRLDKKFPTYRVVNKLQDYLLLKPDNWPQIFQVPREDILGKVIERKRGESSLSDTNWQWIFSLRLILLRRWMEQFISKIKYNSKRIKEILK